MPEINIVAIIAQAFWLVAAAYAANAFPPLVKGKRPLDFGKSYRGKRVLGDGKTFEGTVAGILFGIFIGLILLYFQPSVSAIAASYNETMPALSVPLIILLSVGAIFGDIVGAFIKRRLGMQRGAPAPLLDQLDFITFALIFAAVIYIPSLEVVIFLYIITPIIHYTANLVGYVAKVKATPW